MADEVRTVVKDFNKRLLNKELNDSALPFQRKDMVGFVNKNEFEMEPAPGTRTILEDKVANTTDTAEPGEIRFVFTTALTGPQGTTLDTLLTDHDSTDRTVKQTRRQRDIDHLDELETEWTTYDSMTNAQKFVFLKKIARRVIRQGKPDAAF